LSQIARQVCRYAETNLILRKSVCNRVFSARILLFFLEETGADGDRIVLRCIRSARRAVEARVDQNRIAGELPESG
jgi:hypothetical protein